LRHAVAQVNVLLVQLRSFYVIEAESAGIAACSSEALQVPACSSVTEFRSTHEAFNTSRDVAVDFHSLLFAQDQSFAYVVVEFGRVGEYITGDWVFAHTLKPFHFVLFCVEFKRYLRRVKKKFKKKRLEKLLFSKFVVFFGINTRTNEANE
jgi:hypothetical protein